MKCYKPWRYFTNRMMHYCFRTLYQLLVIKISLTYNSREMYWVLILIACWVVLSKVPSSRTFIKNMNLGLHAWQASALPSSHNPTWLLLFNNNKYKLDICFLLIIFKYLYINVYEITLVTEWVQNCFSSFINWAWFYRHTMIVENKSTLLDFKQEGIQ